MVIPRQVKKIVLMFVMLVSSMHLSSLFANGEALSVSVVLNAIYKKFEKPINQVGSFATEAVAPRVKVSDILEVIQGIDVVNKRMPLPDLKWLIDLEKELNNPSRWRKDEEICLADLVKLPFKFNFDEWAKSLEFERLDEAFDKALSILSNLSNALDEGTIGILKMLMEISKKLHNPNVVMDRPVDEQILLSLRDVLDDERSLGVVDDERSLKEKKILEEEGFLEKVKKDPRKISKFLQGFFQDLCTKSTINVPLIKKVIVLCEIGLLLLKRVPVYLPNREILKAAIEKYKSGLEAVISNWKEGKDVSKYNIINIFFPSISISTLLQQFSGTQTNEKQSGTIIEKKQLYAIQGMLNLSALLLPPELEMAKVCANLRENIRKLASPVTIKDVLAAALNSAREEHSYVPTFDVWESARAFYYNTPIKALTLKKGTRFLKTVSGENLFTKMVDDLLTGKKDEESIAPAEIIKKTCSTLLEYEFPSELISEVTQSFITKGHITIGILKKMQTEAQKLTEKQPEVVLLVAIWDQLIKASNNNETPVYFLDLFVPMGAKMPLYLIKGLFGTVIDAISSEKSRSFIDSVIRRLEDASTDLIEGKANTLKQQSAIIASLSPLAAVIPKTIFGVGPQFKVMNSAFRDEVETIKGFDEALQKITQLQVAKAGFFKDGGVQVKLLDQDEQKSLGKTLAHTAKAVRFIQKSLGLQPKQETEAEKQQREFQEDLEKKKYEASLKAALYDIDTAKNALKPLATVNIPILTDATSVSGLGGRKVPLIRLGLYKGDIPRIGFTALKTAVNFYFYKEMLKAREEFVFTTLKTDAKKILDLIAMEKDALKAIEKSSQPPTEQQSVKKDEPKKENTVEPGLEVEEEQEEGNQHVRPPAEEKAQGESGMEEKTQNQKRDETVTEKDKVQESTTGEKALDADKEKQKPQQSWWHRMIFGKAYDDAGLALPPQSLLERISRKKHTQHQIESYQFEHYLKNNFSFVSYNIFQNPALKTMLAYQLVQQILNHFEESNSSIFKPEEKKAFERAVFSWLSGEAYYAAEKAWKKAVKEMKIKDEWGIEFAEDTPFPVVIKKLPAIFAVYPKAKEALEEIFDDTIKEKGIPPIPLSTLLDFFANPTQSIQQGFINMFYNPLVGLSQIGSFFYEGNQLKAEAVRRESLIFPESTIKKIENVLNGTYQVSGLTKDEAWLLKSIMEKYSKERSLNDVATKSMVPLKDIEDRLGKLSRERSSTIIKECSRYVNQPSWLKNFSDAAVPLGMKIAAFTLTMKFLDQLYTTIWVNYVREYQEDLKEILQDYWNAQQGDTDEDFNDLKDAQKRLRLFVQRGHGVIQHDLLTALRTKPYWYWLSAIAGSAFRAATTVGSVTALPLAVYAIYEIRKKIRQAQGKE